MTEPVILVVSTQDKTDFESWIVNFPNITLHRSAYLPDGQCHLITEESVQAAMARVQVIYEDDK